MSAREELEKEMTVAREGFLLLLENNLDTACLENFAKEHDMGLDNVMFLILEYKKRKTMPCPSKKELFEYNEKSAFNKKRQQGLMSKDIFENLAANYFSPQTINELAFKYHYDSTKILSFARKYLNGEYFAFGVTPSEEEKAYLKVPKLSQIWNAKMSKDIFERLLKDNYSEDTIEKLCASYVMDRKLLLDNVRKYLNGDYASFGFAPTKEEITKKERLFESKTAKSIRIGKEAYESLIHDGALTYALSPIMQRENIEFSTICNYIDEYRKRVVEPKPSKEEEIIYKALMNQSYDKDFIINLSKLDYTSIEKMAHDYNLECLLKKISSIYNAPECSFDEAIRLQNLDKTLSQIIEEKENKKNARTSNDDAVDIIKEYINGTEYDVITTAKRLGKDVSRFKIKKKTLASEEPSIYQAYLEEKERRLEKFAILISDIYEKNKDALRYSILDLALDIDTTIDDFVSFYSAEKKIFFKFYNGSNNGIEGFFGKLLTMYVNANAKISFEKIEKLEYFYSGYKLTPELKEEIISFLNSKNIPTSREMVCLCFEKYVRGEIKLSYQIN